MNLKSTVLATALLVFSFGSFAQEHTGTATMSDTYCVTLDESNPIQKFYTIDIDGVFETEYDANKRFGSMANNLLSYRVNWAEKKTILLVHTDRTEKPETVAWWNNYLSTLCK